MEQEQHLSQYLLKPAHLKKSAEYYSENLNNHSRFHNDSKSRNLNWRMVSKIQNLLDGFSSKESLTHIPIHSFPERFESILGILDKSGVVTAISNGNTRYNDAPSFLSFRIQSSNKPGSTDGELLNNIEALGFGNDSDTSLSKAIGEFLERYILTIYNKKNFQRGSYQEIKNKGFKVLSPSLFLNFSYDQKNFDLDNSQFSWEKVFRVSSGETYFVPAQLIYWNYQRDGEIFLQEPNTNGAGGFFTRNGALLSGLYELIQRDAFLAYWLNTLSPPKINPKTVPNDEFRKSIEKAERYGFEIHCLNTTLDSGIPSFIVAIEDLKKSWPYIVIGGGCGADPIQALDHALSEAWAIYYWMRDQEPFELPTNYQPFTDYGVGHTERIRFWGDVKHSDRFAFFLAGEKVKFSDCNFNYPSKFDSDGEELREAISRVELLGEGYEVYGYLAKHPLLNQLNYFAARVVVPSFLPLYLHESNASLGAKRLKEIPQKLGVPGKLNPWPHPFP